MNDLYEALIECVDPSGAQRAGGRRGAGRACASGCATPGAAFIGGGLHPDAAFGDVVHVETERYQAIRDEMRGPRLAHADRGAARPRRDAGPRDGDPRLQPAARAPAAAAGARRPLAVLARADSGFASGRALIFRAFPRSTIPPAFDELGPLRGGHPLVRATGEIADYTYLWWDIRPSPNLGTVEVRAMDAQSRLESVAGLAALVHALAVGLRRRRRGGRAADRGHRGVLLPRRARRDRRHDLVARRAAPDPRGRRRRARDRAPVRPRPRRRGRARGDRAHPARGRRRGPHARGPRRRRDARGAARLADESYGSTQTTSPIRSQS